MGAHIKSFELNEEGNSLTNPKSDFKLKGREHLEQQTWIEDPILDSEYFEKLQKSIPDYTEESPAIEADFTIQKTQKLPSLSKTLKK